ncbi:fibrinogen-like protein 1 [Elysia marginata]|uniref:Fibrinogen-like protein 1 n=1 Tax=Elysia marginata TaxID=1093978 RepID=A0AAV4IEC9_9GAST|nr:fibrinogen-like protein 1 [Elysia marginata]
MDMLFLVARSKEAVYFLTGVYKAVGCSASCHHFVVFLDHGGCLFCAIDMHGFGLKLSLNKDFPEILGARSPCGVLTCSEKTVKREEKNLTNQSLSFKNILAMEISKSDIPSSNSNHEHSVLVGFISTGHPIANVVSDDIKISGSVDNNRAKMRVEFFNQEDCRSEFLCKIQGLDTQGKKLTSAMKLKQSPERTRGNDINLQAGILSPSVSLQILSIAQQLDTKLAIVAKSSEFWENKLNSLHVDLTAKMVSLEGKVDDKLGQMQREFRAAEESQQIASLERRMEDKLSSLEHRLMNEMVSTNIDEQSPSGVDAHSELISIGEEVKRDIMVSLSNIFQEQQELLANISLSSESLGLTMSESISTLFSSVDSRLGQLQTDGLSIEALAQNMSEAIRLASISAIDGSTSSLFNETLSSQRELLGTFKSLNAKLRASEEKKFDLKDQFEAAMKDVLAPRTCHKGMVIVLPGNSFPYYVIQPSNQSGFDFPYLCDVYTDGGGWIVFQRRTTGNTDFQRPWGDYKRGFGLLYDDFWMGNDRLHDITSTGKFELRVELRYNDKLAYALYDSFSVEDEAKNYRLTLGAYSGNAGDSLEFHNGQAFSTADRDNDSHRSVHCAKLHNGGWWFNRCDHSNLNGLWQAGNDAGVEWTEFAGPASVTTSEMKIRRVY